MAETVLYGYWRSSATYRVRIALNLKGEPYRSVGVDLLSGAQFGAEHSSRHPSRRVPVLEIDGLRLAQSMAIVEYLDETRPGPSFLPETPAERARVRDMVGQIVCDIHPLNNTGPQAVLREMFGVRDEQLADWRRRWILRGFSILEEMLPKAAVFCEGERVSLADIVLVPQIANARRDRLDLSPFPRILAVERRLMALPAFQAAAPEAQPEAAAP